MKRKVDAYHKISINNLKLKVHKAPLREEIELRIAPDEKTGLAEARTWYKDILTDVYQVKNSELNIATDLPPLIVPLVKLESTK